MPMALEMFGCQNREEIVNHSPWEFSPAQQPDGSDSKEKAFSYIHAALQGTPQRFLLVSYQERRNPIGCRSSP